MPIVKHRIRDLHPDVRVYKCGPTRSEQAEQISFVQWVKYHHPEIGADLFHVPNEGKHTDSYRSIQTRMGLSPGIPDLLFWCHPLVIEMKRDKGSLSESQKLRLSQAAEAGQFVAVCYGCEAAKEAFNDYFGVE